MKILLATACLVVAFSLSGNAHAVDPRADHRSCVDNREANSAYVQTRAKFEERAEVVGMGVNSDMPAVGPIVAYRWCDHGNMNHAYVGVIYKDRAGRQMLQQVVEWDEDWDTDQPSVDG